MNKLPLISILISAIIIVIGCKDNSQKDQANWQVIVQPENNYVLEGDTFKANLFLAKKLPADARVHLEDESVHYLDAEVEQDTYTIERKADNLGSQQINGEITFKDKGEAIKLPFSYEYTVSSLSTCITNKYLIQGIGNPIAVSVSGIPADFLMVETSQGELKGDFGAFTIIPEEKGELKITVQAKMPDGQIRDAGTQLFEVR